MKVSCSRRKGISPNDAGSEKDTFFFSVEELVDNAKATWVFRIVLTIFSVRCKFV